MSTGLGARRPSSSRWTFKGHISAGLQTALVYEHRHNGARVLSALELAQAPDGKGDAIQQWHISISQQGRRPDASAVEAALRAFGMVGSEEDNHHPGIARHFWMPFDPDRRVDCECKTDETVVTDADGYQWSNSKDGTCRGCEYARRFNRPCHLHPNARDKGHRYG